MKRYWRFCAAGRAHLAPAIGLGILFLATLYAVPAPAVTINGSTYAANTGGPPVNPASNNYFVMNPTSASASIRSDVTWSHAQSWASAYVTASGVTKTTGGRGWIDTPPTAFAPLYDGKSNLWNAYASGTQIVVNGPGANAAMHFVIPASGIPTSLNAMPANLPAGSSANPAGDPQSITPPADGQGLVVNGTLGAGSMPSFFDVFVQVDATAQQGASPATDLFHGTYTFDPNTGAFQGTGGFAGVNPVITPGNPGDPNAPQFTLTFPTDIVGGSFDPKVGQPFDATINAYMTMGDPGRQFPSVVPTPFDFSNRSGGPVGAGGAFAAQFLLNDPANFTVTVAPEPSSIILAGIALTAAWAFGRRRLLS